MDWNAWWEISVKFIGCTCNRKVGAPPSKARCWIKARKSLVLHWKNNNGNFIKSQNFVNEVGKISEEEGHHPDISFGWGYAEIKITTQAIKGLSENDFILAAKIDKVTNV